MGDWLRDTADGLAHWLGLAEPFAPYVTATVAAVAAAIALLTLRHRIRADSRAEWWTRAEYALDLIREENKVGRNTGMVLLYGLLDDERWDAADVVTLGKANQVLINEITARARRASETSPAPSAGSALTATPQGDAHDDPAPRPRPTSPVTAGARRLVDTLRRRWQR